MSARTRLGRPSRPAFAVTTTAVVAILAACAVVVAAWALGRRCGGRIAGIEQPDRQRSGWNGQPKQKCWRLPRKWHQCFTGDNKGHDYRRRYRWFCGRPVRAPVACGTSPTALGSQPPSATGATAPNSVQGVAEEAPSSTIGLARPGPDGVSMVIVAPRPNRRNEDLHRYSGSKPKLEPYPPPMSNSRIATKKARARRSLS